jgi:hypothetical protein
MVFGENPRKVRNIVEGNYDAFLKLYDNKITVRVSTPVRCLGCPYPD